MIKVFTEFGIGNDSWCSTEFEREDGTEYRIAHLIFPEKVTDVYSPSFGR